MAQFFSDRLARPGYFSGWQAQRMHLRHWLMGGFKQFLHEYARHRKRQQHARPLAADHPDPGAGPERAVEREFARCVVEEACRRTEEILAEAGHAESWRVLMEHYYDGRSYEDLARAMGVAAARVRGMARRARKRYQTALREILAEDGVDRLRMDEAIRHLMEALAE